MKLSVITAYSIISAYAGITLDFVIPDRVRPTERGFCNTLNVEGWINQ